MRPDPLDTLRQQFAQDIIRFKPGYPLATFSNSTQFIDPATQYLFEGYQMHSERGVTKGNYLELPIVRMYEGVELPRYATDGAGCMDLCAYLPPDAPEVEVRWGYPVTIGTGLAVEVPEGWVLAIFSRSGHGFTNSMRLANCVGIIDSDYRGEIKVKLTIDGDVHASREGVDRYVVGSGSRIAQAMLLPAPRVVLKEVAELGVTQRGSGGFGSTGA